MQDSETLLLSIWILERNYVSLSKGNDLIFLFGTQSDSLNAIRLSEFNIQL